MYYQNKSAIYTCQVMQDLLKTLLHYYFLLYSSSSVIWSTWLLGYLRQDIICTVDVGNIRG